MKNRPRHGCVVLSVFAHTRNNSGILAAASHQSLAEAARRLLAILNHAAIPASWYTDEAARHIIGPVLEHAAPGHEGGLFLSSNPHGCARRASIDAQLQQGTAEWGRYGLSVSGVVRPDTSSMDYADLLARHAIRAQIDTLQLTRSQRRSNGWQSVESLRFGVLGLPITLSLSGSGGWSSWSNRFAVQRRLTAVAASGDFAHLALELSHVESASGRRRVEKVVSRLTQLRDRHGLWVGTSAGLSKLLAPRSIERSARSILRAA